MSAAPVTPAPAPVPPTPSAPGPTRPEKLRDFLLGFFGSIVINVLVWGGLVAFGVWQTDYAWISALCGNLVLLLNLIALVFLLLKRKWAGLGMLAAIGLAFALVILAGIIFTAWCFYALAGGK